MTQQWKIDFRVVDGPSTLVPFAAVVAEFHSPSNSPLPVTTIRSLLAETLPSEFMQQIEFPQGDVAFETAAVLLASAIQDLAGPCGLPAEIQHAEDGLCRILLGFHDARATHQACMTALRIVYVVFKLASSGQHTGGEKNKLAVATALKQAKNEMRLLQPDFITRALMRAAFARGIPVYPVSPHSCIWRYGQGSAGLNLFETASQRDSLTGNRLARHKFLSNQLINRLGLPGVRHGVAYNSEGAVQIANQLGFPVVVKPVDGGKGMGVTAGVTKINELTAAFANANRHSALGVIVERYVAGDDHRLAVFGGELKWAVRRTPPRVLGDGKRTVAELIEHENRNRNNDDVVAGFVYRLRIDDDMLKVLSKQGLSLDDQPSAGRSVQLRSIANLATGGTVVNCTASVHPDNREMAESIARCFQLDAAGIDFITSDITKSWRELDCAVIEVNTTPGISSERSAEIVIATRFSAGVDGRIPSVVLIGTEVSIIDSVTQAVRELGKRVGQTSSSETLLAGMPRCKDTDTLPERIGALLLDSSCEALVIGASPEEIERHGFPLDRCDLALLGESISLSAPLRQLVEDCSEEVIDGLNGQNINKLASASLTRVVDKRQ
jgi:D-alanine-D-alanine ligase-like ATP-grasp enzyme